MSKMQELSETYSESRTDIRVLQEKAKAYDEALKKLRTMRDAWNNLETDYSPKDVVHDIEYYFPELKESEDERIRKTLIAVVNLYYGEGEDEEKTACLYWLEKQGEYKKFRDSIQVGDKVIRNEDGVLVNLSQLNRVAKKQGEQKPIGKPTLDVEIPFGMDSELVEETMTIPKGCYAVIEDNKVVIRKSENPAEWSEEVEAAISLLKNLAEEQEKDYCPHNANDLRKAAQYLETCRPQSHWKPSEEQIGVVARLRHCLLEDVRGNDVVILDNLLEQLKAL